MTRPRAAKGRSPARKAVAAKRAATSSSSSSSSTSTPAPAPAARKRESLEDARRRLGRRFRQAAWEQGHQ